MLKKRFVILLTLITLIINSPTFAGEDKVTMPEKITPKVADKRAIILKSYLQNHNSPLQYHAQDLVEAADFYNLDWKLLTAISGVESTFGKFIPGGFNGWGWGVYGNQAIYFQSWREGIFTVSEGLRNNYFNKGLQNPYAMNRVYAASPTWGVKVSYFLKDMEKFREKYERESNPTYFFQDTTQTAAPSAKLALKNF